MPARSPEDRALIARIAASERWGREPDRATATTPARQALRDKWAREIDPTGTLPADELERRVDHLQHAHMLRMTRAAAEGRRRAREGRQQAEIAEAELADLDAVTA